MTELKEITDLEALIAVRNDVLDKYTRTRIDIRLLGMRITMKEYTKEQKLIKQERAKRVLAQRNYREQLKVIDELIAEERKN